MWIRAFLNELGLLDNSPTPLLMDSQPAIVQAKDHLVTSRTKHFQVKFHFLREQVEEGNIIVSFVPGDKNVADILTKPLNKKRFLQLKQRLGVASVAKNSDDVNVLNISQNLMMTHP